MDPTDRTDAYFLHDAQHITENRKPLNLTVRGVKRCTKQLQFGVDA